jgi:hypothetical protein
MKWILAPHDVCLAQSGISLMKRKLCDCGKALSLLTQPQENDFLAKR